MNTKGSPRVSNHKPRMCACRHSEDDHAATGRHYCLDDDCDRDAFMAASAKERDRMLSLVDREPGRLRATIGEIARAK